MATKAKDNSKETKDGKNQPKTNDWVGFFKSIVTSLIIVFIWAIFGSNFLYLQKYVSSGDQSMGTLFPDNPDLPPYSDGNPHPRRGNSAMVGGAINAKRVAMVDRLTGLRTFSSPYTAKNSQEGLFGDFKAWLAESIEFSYVNGRGGLNKMFEMSQEVSNGISPALILFLSVPLVAILLHITPLYGFFSTLFGMFQAPNKGWLWALVFLFVFGIDFIVSGGVAVVQTIQAFMTFLIFPLIVDAKGVFELMGEHHYFFTAILGIFAVSNAFSYLTTLNSVMMLITFLFLMWKNYGK